MLEIGSYLCSLRFARKREIRISSTLFWKKKWSRHQSEECTGSTVPRYCSSVLLYIRLLQRINENHRWVDDDFNRAMKPMIFWSLSSKDDMCLCVNVVHPRCASRPCYSLTNLLMMRANQSHLIDTIIKSSIWALSKTLSFFHSINPYFEAWRIRFFEKG